jgi:uncharacterized protein with LGFP repeats
VSLRVRGPVRRHRLPRRLAVVVALALVVPAALPSAATPTPPVVEAVVEAVPLAGGETVRGLAGGDQLVGVTWDRGQPAPSVQVRWRTAGGWTPWQRPEVTADVPQGEEATTARPGTEPVWRPTGATSVAVRVDRAVGGLRLDRVRDGEVRGGRSFGMPAAHAAVPVTGLGTVLTRSDWGADERMRRGAPSYASTVRAVVVHHTAGGNDYRPQDVPARLRADYAYHVRSRGWADLGYNLVVDRFGRIWEGRAGGVGRPVVGTHAAGFNTGTLGVSVMGDFTRARPSAEVLDALARVSAFAGRTWGFDPAGTVVMTSGGSPRFAKGTQVRLPRVHGHRDTGQTACPGSIHDALQAIRDRAAQLLLPPVTIDTVRVYGAPLRPPAPLVVRGWLSRPVDWRVTVADSSNRTVAFVKGRSAQPRLSWDGLSTTVATSGDPVPVPVPALPGRYTWTITAIDGVGPLVRQSGAFEIAGPSLGSS